MAAWQAAQCAGVFTSQSISISLLLLLLLRVFRRGGRLGCGSCMQTALQSDDQQTSVSRSVVRRRADDKVLACVTRPRQAGDSRHVAPVTTWAP